MRALFATCCLALLLAGCRGPAGGQFGQLTLPPPGTQPPGTLLAGNNYYPGAASTPAIAVPSVTVPSVSGATVASVPSPTPNPNTQIIERRGAALSRTNLGPATRLASTAAPEEPIRIPNESVATGGLAAVVPIRGIPTTDATRLFEAVRSQLAPATSYAARAGFVEISQLPDASPALRQAALSRQSLR